MIDARLFAPAALATILRRTGELGFTMASEPAVGALLRTCAATRPGGRLLELGTGTGLATAWLLSGMDAGASLTSVDTDDRVQQVARQCLGDDPRLTLVIEDGLAFLQRTPSEAYDLVFADAMPGKFEGLHESLRVLRPGGLYIIDDLLPQPNWPDDHAARVEGLLADLSAMPTLAIAALEWASGVIVAAKR
jgi:predicted O-methyltransferase YrrM